jgi:hypothetical protein
MYSPLIGEFLQRDPIEADRDLYRYVGNDPLNQTDPEGLADWLRGTLTYEVSSAGNTVPPIILPAKGDSGLTKDQIQALAEKAAKAWAKNPGKIVLRVDKPCPKGATEGPGKPIKFTREETGNLTIFLKLKKKFGIAGPWEVVVVTDPTKEKDQISLGKITFEAKYKKSLDGKGGPCHEKKTSCDETLPWPVYV